MSVRVSPTEKIRRQIDALFKEGIDLAVVLEQVARLGARLIMQTAVEAEVEEFLGRARDIGLITTLRPFSLPTMAVSDLLSSSQKSALEVMLTRLLSCVFDAPCCGAAPGAAVLPSDESPIELEDTRSDDVPLRWPVR